MAVTRISAGGKGVASGAAVADRRSTANVKPSAAPNRSQAASQARYEGMARSMAPSGTAVPLPTPTPTPTTQNFSQQIDYGQETPAIATPMQPNLSDEEVSKSPEFLARERALAEALDLFRAEQGTGRARFQEDLGSSYRDLGFDPTNQSFDLGQLMSSGQRATTSGRAYNALRNDFAARGMLQSGAYQAQRGILTQQLLDQAKELEKRNTTFAQDQANALAAREQQMTAQRTAAMDEARQAILARMGMGA